jgi:hypothetical protein
MPMTMTMLYIWAISAVVTLVTIYVLLRRWYTPEKLAPEGQSRGPDGS